MASTSVVVVTGGANGIGRALCLRLVGAGRRVVVVDRDEPALAQLTIDCPHNLLAVPGDLAHPATPQRVRSEAETIGTLIAWVNNAAILADAPLHELDVARIDQMLAINLRATILGAQEAIRSFRKSGVAGAIVNITSIHASHPFPGHPVYAAGKGAVEALTRQICVEYGADGIRCNAVAPGAVSTAMTLGLASSEEERSALLAGARALSPMARVSTPNDVADAVLFLLSDRAKSINGHVLAVDNGMAAHGRVPPQHGIQYST